MRYGFTIIYNGAHHLLHNDWYKKLPDMLDYWVIVEGVAQPNGSTFWCKEIDAKTSNDGTVSIINEIVKERQNVIFVPQRDHKWYSKDEMVNAAITAFNITMIDTYCDKQFLWQLDADEQWTMDQMDQAEESLIKQNADCGCFHAEYYVGEKIIAKGRWGEGNDPSDPLENAYRRLWRWNGKKFLTHEPPVLIEGNGREILLPQRFKHYSYRFEKDVKFKSKYYKGYEYILEKWKALQIENNFPQPIGKLLNGYWASTKTIIDRI